VVRTISISIPDHGHLDDVHSTSTTETDLARAAARARSGIVCDVGQRSAKWHPCDRRAAGASVSSQT